MDIAQQVLELLTKELRLKDNVVTPASNLKEDLDVQSLETVELIMALEDRFHVVFEEKAHEKIHTVQDVIDITRKLVK